MEQVVKLTPHDRTTREYTKWKVGQTVSVQSYWDDRITIMPMRLCAPGCLHAYRSIELAALAKPIHCSHYTRAALCTTPKIHLNDGLKLGCLSITPIRWIKLPKPTPDQYIEWATRCNLLVETPDSDMYPWLMRVLSKTDERSETSKIAYTRAYNHRYTMLAGARMHQIGKYSEGALSIARYCAKSVELVALSFPSSHQHINEIAIQVINPSKES